MIMQNIQATLAREYSSYFIRVSLRPVAEQNQCSAPPFEEYSYIPVAKIRLEYSYFHVAKIHTEYSYFHVAKIHTEYSYFHVAKIHTEYSYFHVAKIHTILVPL